MLKVKLIIIRLVGGLLFLPKHWLKVINDLGRDFENKRRFPKAIIDDGVCLDRNVEIGEHSHILKDCIINSSSIGMYSYVGSNSIIQHTRVGNYCSIANDVMCGLGSHPLNRFSTSPIFYRQKNPLNYSLVEDDNSIIEYKSIIIGNDVWVGAKAIILDGVTVGTGAVIAAGAVVTHDVKPYSIVGGVPAKTISSRFDNETIDGLMMSAWWEKTPMEAKSTML